MLGVRILDPSGVESAHTEVEGLGLLPVTTTFEDTKATHRIKGEVRKASGLLEAACGLPLEGYEIHMGASLRTDTQLQSPFLVRERSGKAYRRLDGAIDPTRHVLGTYIHGLFHNSGLRRAVLERLAHPKGVTLPSPESAGGPEFLEKEYDRLAGLVRDSLDMSLIYRIARLK